MAHNQKKQSSGSWKNKRDSHQKAIGTQQLHKSEEVSPVGIQWAKKPKSRSALI